MSSFTKKAIVDSFMALASKKPLEKITVRDIVDHCGINRNTFYYHFQDIYAVLEEVCLSGTNTIDATLPLPEMLEALFLRLTGYAARYPKAMSHIAASIGQSGAERYFAKGFDAPVFEILSRESGGSAERDLLLTSTIFLRHAFVGLFVDYIGAGGKLDAALLADSIALLASGISDAVARKNSDKK